MIAANSGEVGVVSYLVEHNANIEVVSNVTLLHLLGLFSFLIVGLNRDLCPTLNFITLLKIKTSSNKDSLLNL